MGPKLRCVRGANRVTVNEDALGLQPNDDKVSSRRLLGAVTSWCLGVHAHRDVSIAGFMEMAPFLQQPNADFVSAEYKCHSFSLGITDV